MGDSTRAAAEQTQESPVDPWQSNAVSHSLGAGNKHEASQNSVALTQRLVCSEGFNAMIYDVRFYTGDYKARQQAANRDGVQCYVEAHFNSSNNAVANYACVVTARNASYKSKAWGAWYTREIASVFGVQDKGVIVGGFQGRGDGNLSSTLMPAILLEPLFGSTPAHAAIITSQDGQRKLAQVLVASLLCNFPDGGKVGFSIGHKYRQSKPNDRGAAVYGSPDMHEADYAELVMECAARLLVTMEC